MRVLQFLRRLRRRLFTVASSRAWERLEFRRGEASPYFALLLLCALAFPRDANAAKITVSNTQAQACRVYWRVYPNWPKSGYYTTFESYDFAVPAGKTLSWDTLDGVGIIQLILPNGNVGGLPKNDTILSDYDKRDYFVQYAGSNWWEQGVTSYRRAEVASSGSYPRFGSAETWAFGLGISTCMLFLVWNWSKNAFNESL